MSHTSHCRTAHKYTSPSRNRQMAAGETFNYPFQILHVITGQCKIVLQAIEGGYMPSYSPPQISPPSPPPCLSFHFSSISFQQPILACTQRGKMGSRKGTEDIIIPPHFQKRFIHLSRFTRLPTPLGDGPEWFH